MNRKIWKALGIAVCMLALAAPRAMAETNSHYVSNNEQFADAVRRINNESKIGDENEIVLMENITLTGNYTLDKGKKTTIKGKEGEDRKISINGSGAGITVTGEKTVLNLGAGNNYTGTLTIEGDGDPNIQAAFITVSGEATAYMYKNVTLQNRKFSGNSSVHVDGENSVFNLCGGVIQDCEEGLWSYAGAVRVDNQATFNMSSGEIRNCEGGEGGGVHVSNATFVMSGGIISGCTGDLGGGLYADNSTITIKKGTISGCEGRWGCGLYATDSSEITISGGTISGCTGVLGGGLYAEKKSTITITGGTISRCNVGAGGGLYVVGSTLNIKGGTISECSTTFDTGKGGGLYAEKSTITISGGTIKDNKAALGGGVALTNSTVKDEEPITNWTVDGNKAYKAGGGIWLGWGENVKKWDISDKSNKIYNNQAIEHGADICLEGDTSAITLPNAAGMDVYYLDSGMKIDNWYNDNPRHKPSENGKVVDAGVELKGGLSLVASYKADPVRIEIDANGGEGGSGSQTVQKGTTVTLEAPTKEGHLFTGWKDEKGNSYPAGEDGKVNITVTGDMTLTAEWKKLPSAENLPKTGDESPVLLWGAALAVSAAACFVLRRKK